MSFFGNPKHKVSSQPPPPQQPQQQQMQQQPQQQQEVVSKEQYDYALTNFRIAHEKVEEQRAQLEEQERQVAQLRARITQLEGTATTAESKGKGGNTVDDFSIKNAASALDKMINRWASDLVRKPPVPLTALCQAIVADIGNGPDVPQYDGSSMHVTALLRHALSETISEGIINNLIVTNSPEANAQLTRIHEHIFARDPTVACVWRRQTFSAAVETFSEEMTILTLQEHVPELMKLLNNVIPTSARTRILESAYSFSRMLHGQNMSMGDAFYRSFVPELGSVLHPKQIELVRRCLKSERGQRDRVGATIFPGLVKLTKGSLDQNISLESQNIVRRAQVICECALNSGSGSAPSSAPGTPQPQGYHGQQGTYSPPPGSHLQYQHTSSSQQQHFSTPPSPRPGQAFTSSPPASVHSHHSDSLPAIHSLSLSSSSSPPQNYAPPQHIQGRSFSTSPPPVSNYAGSPPPHVQGYNSPPPTAQNFNYAGSPPPIQNYGSSSQNYGSSPGQSYATPPPQGYGQQPQYNGSMNPNVNVNGPLPPAPYNKHAYQ